MRILVIDDDRFWARSMEYYLKEYGFTVSLISKFADVNYDNIKLKFDVVVLDLMLRRPDDSEIPEDWDTGEYIYTEIKKNTPDKRIIIVTAVDRPKLESRFKVDGTDLLIKPLDPSFKDLIECIKK